MSDDQSNPFAAPQADDFDTHNKRVEGLTLDDLPEIRNCPQCGSDGATPAPYNWWRGRRAPTATGHVVCPKCNCEFNGETGVAYPPASSPWPFFIVAVVLFVLYLIFYIGFHAMLIMG